jgi:hypothetical protein
LPHSSGQAIQLKAITLLRMIPKTGIRLSHKILRKQQAGARFPIQAEPIRL